MAPIQDLEYHPAWESASTSPGARVRAVLGELEESDQEMGDADDPENEDDLSTEPMDPMDTCSEAM